MKQRFWAVIMNQSHNPTIKYPETLCFTWDKKHPEDKRKEQSVLVWAIYPKKKDALADARFRGDSYVEEVNVIRRTDK